MPNTKEIRGQIASIGNTQKITSAMEKVAASKMKKPQDRMERGRPSRNRMLEVIGHLANGQTEYKPTYMIERQPKKKFPRGPGVAVRPKIHPWNFSRAGPAGP